MAEKVSEGQRKLLRIVAGEGRMDCEDSRLDEFSDDSFPIDTFNACCDAGWLKVWHDNRFDISSVEITDAGRALLREE